MIDTETSPVIAEFLRQVNQLPEDNSGVIDLHAMWEAAGRPCDGRPDRWRDAVIEHAVAFGHDDRGVVLEDGRIVAERRFAVDYAVRLDIDLKYQAEAFAKIGTELGAPLSLLAVMPTPMSAVVVIGALLRLNPDMGLADAVASIRRFIATYAEHSMESSWKTETTVAQMQRALRGEMLQSSPPILPFTKPDR